MTRPATRAPTPHLRSPPSDDEIQNLVVEQIDAQRRSVGVVVGIITPEGRRVVAYGVTRRADGHPVDGDTTFEIASVTKVFTALLLTEMVQRAEVALDAPVATYLPADIRVPQRKGRQITLVDLARAAAAAAGSFGPR